MFNFFYKNLNENLYKEVRLFFDIVSFVRDVYYIFKNM